MKWLRNLLDRSSSKKAPAPEFKPELETLEAREVPNSSSVFDAAGNLSQLVVYQGGNAFLYNNSGGTLVGQNVRVGHLFRDQAGRVGIDLVYNNGFAFEYDSSGAKTLGTGNVLDASRAYGPGGTTKLEVIYAAGGTAPFGPDTVGNWFEYSNTGVTLQSQVARWATAYLDPNGQIGLAYGLIDAVGNLNVFRADTTFVGQLYSSPDGATQDLTDYSQTTNTLNRQTFVDVTFGRFAGTYALQVRPSGAQLIGNGVSVQVGG